MLTMTAVLLVTAVTMAQADQMSDLLNLPHHKDHIYIFDVISESPVHELKAALANFTVDEAFKVVGENRFFFKIISKDTAKLRALSFPAGTKTTQHAVEHLGEHLQMFGVKTQWKDQAEANFTDSVLLFIDGTIKVSQSTCSKTFAMEMRKWAQQYKATFTNSQDIRAYPILASYPPKMFLFEHVRENPLQSIIQKGIPAIGGSGSVQIKVKRVVKI